jgi:WXXGXW repeat (2 copies)
MKRMIVAAVAAVLLALASGTAMADSSSKSVFPRYEDPWRNWGKPHPKQPHVNPPQAYHYHHYYVWVQGYWWWSGTHWVWIPGYWRAAPLTRAGLVQYF